MDVREKLVTGMDEYIDREAAQTSCRKYSFAERYDAFAVGPIMSSQLSGVSLSRFSGMPRSMRRYAK